MRTSKPMRTSKRILTSLVLAGGLVLGAVTVGMADQDRHGGDGKQCSGKSGHPVMFRHHGPGPGLTVGLPEGVNGFEHQPPFLRGLKLTEEQRDKIFEITYAQIPIQRTFHKEMRALHQQLRKLPLSADYDAGKMKKLVDAQAKLQADHLLKIAEADNRIYKLLTDDQRKQLAERKVHKKPA
ncbi:MAG TPA: Spy/CpxP family protein refolding chaperone [Dongiaceae bacterium]|nr:Spy/CpxP family protein refolding chaperone [Dongiaceae bacterium]